ncbi:hypothetical protein QCA50_015152 [Cerrena zonata]|uniref:Protein kinase domain-containing protein n=1 Tax=Cerrena zonata TaxID=2478898 RepID=A0AAW0FYF0_9APHY
MNAISQYTTPTFLNDAPYLRNIIETLEAYGSANAKCTVCNKKEAVAEHAYCCSIECAHKAFMIACRLDSALRALDADNQYVAHWPGDIAEYAMNVMLAIAVNSPDIATQQGTVWFLMKVADHYERLPGSFFLEGRDVDISYQPSVGGFVFRTTYNGMTVAAKRLIWAYDRNGVDEHMRWMCYREALMWKTRKHERLLSLSGVVRTDQDYFMISSWHRDGDSRKFLEAMVQSHKRYRWGRFYQLLVYRWLLQVVEGLQYLHKRGATHGNLHSGNVLVVNPQPNSRHLQFDIVLTDFGLGIIQEVNNLQQGSSQGRLVQAPEQIHPDSNTQRPTAKSDIFTFAALCFHLYTTRPIYPALEGNNYEIRRDRAILSLEPLDREVTVKVQRENIQVVIPDELWEIIERCWTVPEDRPTLDWIEEKLKGMQGSLSAGQY